jgi:hypothetical protein
LKQLQSKLGKQSKNAKKLLVFWVAVPRNFWDEVIDKLS